MNKKSQGLSINVIIIVAIALIVLVVLVAVFTGRVGTFTKGVDSTATCANSCASFGMSKGSDTTDRGACTSQDGGHAKAVPGTYSDVAVGSVCCCRVSGGGAAQQPQLGRCSGACATGTGSWSSRGDCLDGGGSDNGRNFADAPPDNTQKCCCPP